MWGNQMVHIISTIKKNGAWLYFRPINKTLGKKKKKKTVAVNEVPSSIS